MIIKESNPGLIVIDGEAVAGTSFTVSTITLNASLLSNPQIKIDFASNVFSNFFDKTIVFQVFKIYNNQSSPIPVGPERTFSATGLVTKTFSFFVYDSDTSNSEWCTYTVVATIR